MLCNRIFYFLTLCFLLDSFGLFGQTDTILVPEVEVVGSTIREVVIGGDIQSWNAEKESTAVTDIGSLLNSNGIFIKSYGANSLATSSIRGGSAGHTLVLWNGLPVQSPMLGLLNLTLLPINSVEEVTVQKGGSSALWGSGAIGGVVNLKNQADFQNRFSLAAHSAIGSFGQFENNAKLAIGNTRFQSVTKVLHRKAKNDFYYPVAPDFPERQQSNAAFEQLNILQDLYYATKNGHRFSAHYWHQSSDKQLPPTITQSRSEAHQNDKANRFILGWQEVRQHFVMKAKVAWFKEHLDYYNDLSGLESLSHFNTLLSEWTGEYYFKNNHTLLMGANYSNTRVTADGYGDTQGENKAALFASYQFRKEKVQFQAILRQEMVDGTFTPTTPVLSADYQPFTFLSVKGKISRNYRLPTFNDRFWLQGGNPNLLAESGWSQEATLDLHQDNSRFQIAFSSTFFNRQIDNWIMWVPLNGQIWSANNITKVWSRGIEERLSIAFAKNNTTLKIEIGYDHIRSTNEVTLILPAFEKGDQLLYTPRNVAFGSVTFIWKGLQLNYRHNYRGKSEGVNELLSSYQTGTFHAQYTVTKNKWNATIFGSINNTWDTDYFVVERRPMPGRWFRMGIKTTFNR